MADAEDLKSSGDFSSCGFDSHPGHQSFYLKTKSLFACDRPCTSGVPHFAKVPAGRDSRRSPNLLRVVPAANAPMAHNVFL
jgi:hypothetical protein